jgi:DNA-binding transcriptional LysR family regulator
LFDSDPATVLHRVQAGTLDIGLGPFPKTPGVRRTRFFRFSLMVVRPEDTTALRRSSTTWSALKGETLILQGPTHPSRQLIDRYLAQAGVTAEHAVILNRLDTVIAMVEAGEGIGIVPSYTLPVCRRRKVSISPLTNPVAPLEFYQIRNRGRKLPAVADEFTLFLQSYIARWAGRAGIL